MRRANQLLTALAALALSTFGLVAAEREGFSMEVLVDGSVRTEYSGRGALYIEALRGKNYQIRLHNPLPCRVAVALAVDGLNSIDAKHTDAQSARKWVLGPYETVTIPGWQISGTQARAFTFTGERGSYGAALGETQNLGVLEAVFFRELPPQPTVLSGILEERDSSRYEEQRAGRGAAEKRQKSQAPAPQSLGSGQSAPTLSDEYAATGMGSHRRHAVTQVHLELEQSPAASVRLRYEFRPVLVKLGVLPKPCPPRPLDRREGSHGFEFGFCPPPGR